MFRVHHFKLSIPILALFFLLSFFNPLLVDAATITPGACGIPAGCDEATAIWMFDPAARAQTCTTETVPQYSNCGTVSLNPPPPAGPVSGTRNCNIAPPIILYPTQNLSVNSGGSLSFRINAASAVSVSITVKNTVGTEVLSNLNLYDDGFHNDYENDDKIWGNTWFIPTSLAIGAYAIDVTINGNQTNPSLGSFNVAAPSACVQVVNNGNTAQKLDIVYLSEQYSGANLTAFRSDVNKFKNKLLSYEPFKAQSGKINIWLVENTDSLGCKYEDRLITCNTAAVLAKASICNYDVIGVIVNSATYGGGGGEDFFSSYNGQFSSSIYYGENVAVHEFGHTFGKLKDEYSYDVAPPGAVPGVQGSDPYYWLDGGNCDNNVSCTKWASSIGSDGIGCFINDNGTGHVGCQYNEWYRPLENNSMMLDMGGGFNLVNRLHLESLLSAF